MTTAILLLTAGLALLLAGANFLVDSAIAIARRAKISDFAIGIAVVGIGTSLPELFVSVSSAIQGMGDMAVGNVVGSNICNIFLILGITAIISPFAVTRQNMARDIPFGILVSVLLLLLCSDTLFPRIIRDEVGRLDGLVFLLIFAGYMAIAIMHSKKEEKSRHENEENATSRLSGKPAILLWAVAAVSLAALLYGGNMFLDNTVTLARQCGISDKVVSLTIVAVGTSLPELVTCIVAAIRKSPQLAMGNVLGSNIFNILGILGISSLINPLVLTDVNIIDFCVMILAAVLTFVCAFTFKRHTIDRHEGIIFVALYIAYIACTVIFQ